MYRIIIHKKVFKFIKTRSDLEKTVIREKIDLLKLNPTAHSELDIKKLKGVDNNIYRLRIGSTRIIYQVEQDDFLIIIIAAGKRGDIYKKI